MYEMKTTYMYKFKDQFKRSKNRKKTGQND